MSNNITEVQVQDCRESLRLREDSATRPILEKGSWKTCPPNAALKHHCPKRRTPCGALTTTKHVNHTPVRGADQAVGYQHVHSILSK